MYILGTWACTIKYTMSAHMDNNKMLIISANQYGPVTLYPYPSEF